MSRLRASTIHLALSAFVGTVLLALFWWVWYPSPLFRAVGGAQIFLMLLGIDVILGPLLTFVVFNATKKSLRFDLAVVATLQIAALSYGVYTLLVGRPVYVAALGHRFDVVQASDVVATENAALWIQLSWWGPTWVGTRTPIDPMERARVMSSALAGADLSHFPQYHQPLINMRDEILKNASPVSSLAKFNVGKDADIQRWLADHGRTIDNTVFQGLKARAEDMAVIMDGKTAEVIGIAPFKPWD